MSKTIDYLLANNPIPAITDTTAGVAAAGGVAYGFTFSQVSTWWAPKAVALTNKSIDASANTLTNLTVAMFASGVIDTDGTFAANSDTRLATQKATKTYVAAQIAALVASSPAALDTLNELAAALGNDANFAATTATSLGNRLRVDTAGQGLNGTQKTNAKTNIDLQNVDNTSDATKNAATATLTNKTLDTSSAATLTDANFTLVDDGDATKQVKFQLSGLTTGNTRVITVPDASFTMARIDAAQSFTGTQTFLAGLTLSGVPTFADDTAAGTGGLTAGQIYKTSTGVLMIKL